MTDGPHIEAERIEGRVIEVDHYGNLITNIVADLLKDAPRDERLRVSLGEHETYGLWQTYGENPPQTLVAIVGSENFVEVALVNGNAAEMLGAGVGNAVCIEWGNRE